MFSSQQDKPMASARIYEFTMKTIEGKTKSLSDYAGKVLLVVNVASECGYTPQYKDLEEVYRKYHESGLEILGFPANNFGAQEPGTDQEIKEFCTTNYGVTFDMFSKISVKGDDQHPLYTYLTTQTKFPGPVKWNFQKYLVNRKGEVVAMIPTKIKPTEAEIMKQIEQLLSEQN
jgi:glutathione peroxidase